MAHTAPRTHHPWHRRDTNPPCHGHHSATHTTPMPWATHQPPMARRPQRRPHTTHATGPTRTTHATGTTQDAHGIGPTAHGPWHGPRTNHPWHGGHTLVTISLRLRCRNESCAPHGMGLLRRFVLVTTRNPHGMGGWGRRYEVVTRVVVTCRLRTFSVVETP